MSLAFRAGISERDFWGMTAHNVCVAFSASEESLSRWAFRAALFSKLKNTVYQNGEDKFFAPKAAKTNRPQSLADQMTMFKFLTKALPPSKEKH